MWVLGSLYEVAAEWGMVLSLIGTRGCQVDTARMRRWSPSEICGVVVNTLLNAEEDQDCSAMDIRCPSIRRKPSSGRCVLC